MHPSSFSLVNYIHFKGYCSHTHRLLLLLLQEAFPASFSHHPFVFKLFSGGKEKKKGCHLMQYAICIFYSLVPLSLCSWLRQGKFLLIFLLPHIFSCTVFSNVCILILTVLLFFWLQVWVAGVPTVFIIFNLYQPWNPDHLHSTQHIIITTPPLDPTKSANAAKIAMVVWCSSAKCQKLYQEGWWSW